MPPHRIVTVAPGDASLLATIHAACFEEIWDAAAIEDILAMPGTLGLVARYEDDPAGLAFARIAADEAELLSLGVVPRHRCQGLGGVLLGAICAAALAGGAVRIFLEVAADNQSALRLYRGAGFAESGFRRGYYVNRPDSIDARTALVMRRDLTQSGRHS